MICVECTQPSRITNSGLCRDCKTFAHGRSRRGDRAAYWIGPHFDSIRANIGMTIEAASVNAAALYHQARKRFKREVVLVNNLDNPYMSQEARLVIINLLIRECYTRKHGISRNTKKLAVSHVGPRRTERKEAA